MDTVAVETSIVTGVTIVEFVESATKKMQFCNVHDVEKKRKISRKESLCMIRYFFSLGIFHKELHKPQNITFFLNFLLISSHLLFQNLFRIETHDNFVTYLLT